MNLKNIKLKTLLIYPPLLNRLDRKIYFRGAPIGIAVLSGYLKKRGYRNLRSINLQNDEEGTSGEAEEPSRLLEKHLRSGKPDIVGFSVLLNQQMPETIRLAEKIKNTDKKIFIFAGGNGVSGSLERLLKHEPTGLDIFDAFIAGDGEEALARLIHNINSGKSLKNIPNLIFKDKKTGRFRKSDKLFAVSKKDLHIKPDYTGLNISSVIPIRASIGCYWSRCAFCYNSGKKRKYELADEKKLVALIRELKKETGQKDFFFYDDSLPPFYLKKLAKELIKQSADINWMTRGACVDKGFKEKGLPELLKRSGCQTLNFGAESFSPRIIRLMNKMQIAGETLKITRPLKEAGIRIVLYTMFGFPTETEEDIEMTLSALENNQGAYDLAYVNYFNLDGDSDIARRPENFKISIIDNTDPKFPKFKSTSVPAKRIVAMIKKHHLEKKVLLDKTMRSLSDQ